MERTSFPSGARAAHDAPLGATKTVVVIENLYTRFRTVLLIVIIIIIALGTFRTLVGATNTFGKLRLFNFDNESSLPTWWSILQLAGASALLLLNGLADQTRRWRYYWFFLAVVFIFLSLDEAAEIHETMFAETLAPYAVNQFLRFTWIIPYAFAALLVAAIYVPFLHALPAKTRWGMVVAGALYVAAAVGAEALGAYCSAGGSSLCLKFSVIFEESGEIIAIALFLLVLLKLLQLRCPMIAARL